MNIVIQKLKLPSDLKNEIYKYCYNTGGYTVNDLIAIEKEKNKKRTQFMKLRLKLELSEWYKYNVAVCWLKPTGRGVYGSLNPSSVYGGGTLYESRLIREFNLVANYINEKLLEGDNRRRL